MTTITIHTADETECDEPMSPHPGDLMDGVCAHGSKVHEVYAD